MGEYDCPTCKKKFDSKRSVINHHNHHARPYFDAIIEDKYGVPTGWLLYNLYQVIGKTSRQIAEDLGYTKATILKHLKRHGIELRKNNREKPVHFATYTNTSGFAYERWDHNMADGAKQVYVHRLLAVALYGYESVANYDVHHKNEIPWDNRPENIELMEHGEHSQMHSIEQFSD